MSDRQAALWEYRQAEAAWKEDLMADLDEVEQVIFQIAGGDPERIERYRWDYTHTAVIEAYISKIIS
jgi:hypothetical protein